jgi:hypothetical protein
MTGAAPAKRMTLDELRKLPPVVDVATAAAALGVGRSTAYDAIARGEFPAKVIVVGCRLRVVTASLIGLLDNLGGRPLAQRGSGRARFHIRPRA